MTKPLSNSTKKLTKLPVVIFMAASDDLFFWPLIDTLFLSLAKGFTAAEITFAFAVSFWVAFGTKYPCYKIAMKMKMGNAVFLSTVLFLASAVFITIGNSIVITIIGLSLYLIAPDFYDLTDGILRDVCINNKKGMDFVHCRSAASFAYAVVTLAAAVSISKLMEIDPYVPMYICIGLRIFSLLLGLYIMLKCDNSVEKDERLYEPKSRKSFDKATLYFILAGSAFFTLFSLCNTNLKLVLQSDLESVFDEKTVIMLFSYCIIGTRVVKILGNFLVNLFGKLNMSYDRMMFIMSVMIIIAPLFGLASYLFTGMTSVIMTAIGLSMIYLIFDSFCNVHSFLVTYKLNRTQIVSSVFFGSTISILFSAVVSSAITITIKYASLRESMYILLLVGIVVVFLAAKGLKFYNRSVNGYKKIWGDEAYDNVESIYSAAAVLMAHYGIANPAKINPAVLSNKIDKIEDIDSVRPNFHYVCTEEYDFSQLLNSYMDGFACAVYARKGDKWCWYPITYLDEEDATVYSYGNEEVFISEFDECSKQCIFSFFFFGRKYKEIKKFINSR